MQKGFRMIARRDSNSADRPESALVILDLMLVGRQGPIVRIGDNVEWAVRDTCLGLIPRFFAALPCVWHVDKLTPSQNAFETQPLASGVRHYGQRRILSTRPHGLISRHGLPEINERDERDMATTKKGTKRRA
jgi:hypothetical protein